MFVCHGNICRSPMAEYVLKDLLANQGLLADYQVASSATSREALNHPVHHQTRQTLKAAGVACPPRRAVQFKQMDYTDYDHIVVMDQHNYKNLLAIIGSDSAGKVRRLLSYAGEERDVLDPWYTGDFDTTYQDVVKGCQALLAQLISSSDEE